MAHDAGIAEQAFDILLREIRDTIELEIVESLPEVLALAQYGQPGKPRLETLKANLLEQTAVIRNRTAPFMVVVVTVKSVIAVPCTTHPPVVSLDQSGLFFAHVEIFPLARRSPPIFT
jgi:hypothetical protein